MGRAVGEIVGRSFGKLGFDATMRKTAMGRAVLKSGFTSSELMKTLTKWAIYIVSLLLALRSLEVPFLEGPIDSVLDFIPNLIIALIIFVFGGVVSDWVGEIIKKSFIQEGGPAFYTDLIGNLLKAVLYFVVITIALSELRIDVTILNTIAQAFAWGLAIFVGISAGIVVGWMLKDRLKDLAQE
ncbi:MAG: hypothetical protein QFX35_03705 [Candidatus Verstraetearchaeota archaeon]|nr:hypothetical protein [Candidatus Verstraetearchaeota archaeon]